MQFNVESSTAKPNQVPNVIGKNLGDAGVSFLKENLALKIITILAKEIPNIAAKKIPIVSISFGTKYALDRCVEGQCFLGAFEIASGVAGSFPVVGTVASITIDIGLLIHDILDELL
jgi:hypothetical protein